MAAVTKVLRGGSLVTPDGVLAGDVVLEGAHIAAVVPGGLDAAQLDGCEVFDVAGCWVFPGFIDAHTPRSWTTPRRTAA